jgi:hypothetical protein
MLIDTGTYVGKDDIYPSLAVRLKIACNHRLACIARWHRMETQAAAESTEVATIELLVAE